MPLAGNKQDLTLSSFEDKRSYCDRRNDFCIQQANIIKLTEILRSKEQIDTLWEKNFNLQLENLSGKIDDVKHSVSMNIGSIQTSLKENIKSVNDNTVSLKSDMYKFIGFAIAITGAVVSIINVVLSHYRP